MNFFHPILSRASLVASASVNPLSLQSSSIQSSHLFLGRPLPLFTSFLPYIAIYGNLSALILSTCPKYFNLCVCIFPTKSSLSPDLRIISVFRTCCLLLIPIILRKHAISKTCKRRVFSTLSVHVSALYSTILRISISYTFSLVLHVISLDLHSFPSFCIAPYAIPILLLIS